jgi:hypothetical protein
MTKIFNLIPVEDYAVIIYNPPEEQGDWVINIENKKIGQIGKSWDSLERKIIATIGKRIEGIPLIELPDDKFQPIRQAAEAWEKTKDRIDKSVDNKTANIYWMSGYMTAQRGTFSEEDIKKGVATGIQDWQQRKEQTVGGLFSDIMSVILSLQQKKLPIQVELEIELYLPHPGLSARKERIKTTNPETNTITPINIIYGN